VVEWVFNAKLVSVLIFEEGNNNEKDWCGAFGMWGV
jgi:hypothetical protein